MRIGIIITLLLPVGCGSHWPPAVTTVAEIERLPETQRDIRGIDIGDVELKLIVERFPRLTYVFLNSKSAVTDDGVKGLSTLRELRQIVIVNATELSDASICSLAAAPALTRLIVENGTKLTDASIDALSENENFQILYVTQCPRITAEAKERARRRLPTCEFLFD